MTDSPPVEKQRKGMLGFYVGLGTVTLLLVGGWFAWTPLRVWCLEREVIEASNRQQLPRLAELEFQVVDDDDAGSYTCLTGYGDDSREGSGVAAELAALGPDALPAVRRLLTFDSTEVRLDTICGLRFSRATWALPCLVEAARSRDERTAAEAILAVDELAGRDLLGREAGVRFSTDGGASERTISRSRLKACRRKVLDWWEREGRAKYRRGAE